MKVEMKQKSISKNIVMNSILTVSNFLFPLITYSYVARVLTPSGTGQIAFVDSILAYFGYFASLGVPAYGRREVAKLRDDKLKLSHLVQELFIFMGASTIISYILLWVAILVIPKLQQYCFIFLIMGSQIVLKTIGVEWLYQGLEEFSYITKRSLLFKVISVILTFILIRNRSDILWYAFVHVFTVCASYICNFINVRKFITFNKEGKYELKRHLKPIIILFSASSAITIYGHFDVSMLGFLSTESEVGLYNAALRIKSIVLALSTAITAVLVPRMAYYFERKEKERITELLSKSVSISMMLAVPISVYIMIYSEEVLTLIGGIGYIAAAGTLRVLTVCILALIITNLCGVQILIPIGNEKRYTQSVIIGLFINLTLNSLLIPSYGALGAAIGTLVTEIWNVLWMGTGCIDYLKDIRNNDTWLKYLITLIASSAISFLACREFPEMHLIVFLIANAIIYFGIYYGCLLLLKEPLLIEIINKIKGKLHSK